MPEKPNLPEDGSNLDNQPTQPYLPPEVEDSQDTRAQSPENRTRNMPPVQDARLVQPSPRRAAYNKARQVPEKPKVGQQPPVYEHSYPPSRAVEAGRESRNPLSIPIWSVLLMLFMVCGAVSCIVVAVLGLGGRTAPALAPQFVVITAAPTQTLAITLPALSASATFPAGLQGQQAGAVTLAGPTLPPVIISPTPESIGVGKSVIVDSKESGLNVRSAPGVIGTDVLFVVQDGAQFNVVDGPAQADGFTWWKIQNPTDATQSGWAAAVFLQIAPQPQQ
jgi:SH3 domain-containing protein